MFSQFFKSTPDSKATPAEEYFLQKIKGNKNLKQYEEKALEYIKNNPSADSAADVYFKEILKEIEQPLGIVPSYMWEKIAVFEFQDEAETFVREKFNLPDNVQDDVNESVCLIL